jgi:hypothetical protein
MSEKLRPARNWLIVAAADHVRRGRAEGFVQVNHGKLPPLRRIMPGDRVVCYSPSTGFRGKDRLQSFTAIGIAGEGEPYQVEMSPDFSPFRREIAWLESQDVPIQPLLPELELTAGKSNWGYQMRFGLLPLSEHDMDLIATAMGVYSTPVSE